MECEGCKSYDMCKGKDSNYPTVMEVAELFAEISGIQRKQQASQQVETIRRVLDNESFTTLQRGHALSLMLYFDSKRVDLVAMVRPNALPITETSKYGYLHEKGVSLETALSTVVNPEKELTIKQLYYKLPPSGLQSVEIACMVSELLKEKKFSTQDVAVHILGIMTYRQEIDKNQGSLSDDRKDVSRMLETLLGKVKGVGGSA